MQISGSILDKITTTDNGALHREIAELKQKLAHKDRLLGQACTLLVKAHNLGYPVRVMDLGIPGGTTTVLNGKDVMTNLQKELYPERF